MPLAPQPLPWTVMGRSEIGDSAGNVVQYTVANLGAICLAVNAHDRLIDALMQVEAWLRTPPAARCIGDPQILDLVSAAIGKMGVGALAAKIEDAPEGSPELDRAISVELQLPEAAYTSSIDMALSLVAPEYVLSFMNEERLNQTGQPASYIVVYLKSGDKSASAASLSLPLAICAAALRTREI